MSRFVLGDGDNATDVDFASFAFLLRGSCITEIDKDGQAIRLTEDLRLGIEPDPKEGVKLTLSSTLSKEAAPTIRIELMNEGANIPLHHFQKKMRSLSKLHSMLVMLEQGRQDELGQFLLKDPSDDLFWALKPDDQLILQAAGPGSFWVTVGAIAKGIASAPQKALNTIVLIYGPGRYMALERVRANTDRVRAAADAEQAKARKINEEAERIRDQRIMELVKQLERTKSREGKEVIRRHLAAAMREVNPQLADEDLVTLLTGAAERGD
jgi:hypothetical protein